jgi:L-ascorbate peroxidase
LGLAGSAAAPLLGAAPADAAIQILPASSLSSLQKRDVLNELIKRAEGELKKVLTPADIAGCMRLLLADAGTYDAATKTGGADGSIVLT